ncbi:MAG: hypothetical protein IKL10_09105 [Clostridia bacterium]|nr:hypothetical protein [Clostridia bacterium]
MINIIKEKGENLAFFILTLVNGIFYGVWFLAYIICSVLRYQAFNTAQTNMMISGFTNFTVEVTSPFFAVLKFAVLLLPVILAVWTVMMFIIDHKGKKLCDKWLVIAVFAVDFLCALIASADIISLHMIFV